MNKKVGKDEFSDILNSHGFKSTSSNEPTSMNALRQQNVAEDDPVKAKVTTTKQPINIRSGTADTRDYNDSECCYANIT